MSSGWQRPAHVPELDGLRAVAILLVVGCHYRGFAALFGGLPQFGWVGVDLFFALSGYLITSILLGLRHQRSAYVTFYSRRAVRILPPYTVAVALMLVVAAVSGQSELTSKRWIVTQPLFLQALPAGPLHGFLELLRHPLNALAGIHLLRDAHALPSAPDGTTPSLRSQMGAYWSLSIEEYFYLLWAPVVLACSRRTTAWVAAAVCAAEMLLRAASGSMDSYFIAFYRFDALLYGALLALVLERCADSLEHVLRTLRWLLAAALCGLGIIAAALWPVVGREIRESPLFLSVGLSLIAIASTALIGLLIGMSGSRWWVARALRAKWMRDLGRISYTMYLTHLLVAWALLAGIRHFVPGAEALNLPESLVALELTIGVAALSWRVLEGPAQRWKNARPGMRAVAQDALQEASRPGRRHGTADAEELPAGVSPQECEG